MARRQRRFEILMTTPAALALALLPHVCTARTTGSQPRFQSAGNAAPPNIVLIIADDLGNNDIRSYNPSSFYRTPNLDRLARISTRFTDSYAAASICSPSRYSLMTGRFPVRANATDWFRRSNEAPLSGTYMASEHNDFMPLDETTIAKVLKRKGYQTAFIGKWHLGENEKYWPEHQGYDINIGGFGAGSPTGTKGYFAPYRNPRLKDGPPGEYLTRRLASEADGVISRYAARKKPFFLTYATYAVHVPLGAPEETIARYRDAQAKSGTQTLFGVERQVLPGEGIRRVRLTQTNVTYAAMVQELDAAVGVVLSSLKRNGLANNTIVIFTSDNGGLSTAEGLPTSNMPLRAGKGWSYEGGLRVPLLIHLPRQHAGRVVSDVAVCGIDLSPTIADFAGAETMAKADGWSLRRLIGGDSAARAAFDTRALYWHYPNYSNQGGIPTSSVRQGPFKLIQDLETGRTELYNVTVNPAEQYDLSATMPAESERLLTLLNQWRTEAGVRYLRPRPGGPTPWAPTDKSAAPDH